jgi:hypothetical protein
MRRPRRSVAKYTGRPLRRLPRRPGRAVAKHRRLNGSAAHRGPEERGRNRVHHAGARFVVRRSAGWNTATGISLAWTVPAAVKSPELSSTGMAALFAPPEPAEYTFSDPLELPPPSRMSLSLPPLGGRYERQKNSASPFALVRDADGNQVPTPCK